MLNHRRLENQDAEMICAFPQSPEELFYLFPNAAYPLTPAQLLEAARKRHDPTVVTYNNQVAGYGNFFQISKGESCSIGNIVVNPAFRNRGAASYLIKHLVKTAFINYRVRYVYISCINHNSAGLLLYHKLGFKPFEIEERQTQTGERVALIHMQMTARHI
jgi:ribosomal protein S18 acetylase RimI-like enzyme